MKPHFLKVTLESVELIRIRMSTVDKLFDFHSVKIICVTTRHKISGSIREILEVLE